jgi:hypothetical protein
MHAMGVHSLSIGGRFVEGSEILCWLFGDHHFALSKSCRQTFVALCAPWLSQQSPHPVWKKLDFKCGQVCAMFTRAFE